jgi:DNA-binding transcriptional LysR family regulator
MDQITAMRVFARVVEAGTFTRAADSLQMPKPTVTKLVQQLETHLRVKLLQRTTRRVTVTPEGAAYYERTARVLAELEDIESDLTNAQANPRGRLRVDIGSSLANMILIPQLPAFHARYPGDRTRTRRERPAGEPGRRCGRLRDPRRRAERPVAGGAPHRHPALRDLRDAGLPEAPRRAEGRPPTWATARTAWWATSRR